ASASAAPIGRGGRPRHRAHSVRSARVSPLAPLPALAAQPCAKRGALLARRSSRAMARHKRESTEILNRNEVSRREFLQIAGAAAGLTLLPRLAAANARVIRAEPALA